MFEAFFWGAVGASALLVGALIAYVTTPSVKVIAIVMALGAGLLIGSISFELIDEALKSSEVAAVGLYTLIGAATFTPAVLGPDIPAIGHPGILETLDVVVVVVAEIGVDVIRGTPSSTP